MERRSHCEACSRESRPGVFYRIGVPHTCGTTEEQREKQRRLDNKAIEEMESKATSIKSQVFAIREQKELARQDVAATPKSPESYWKQRFS